MQISIRRATIEDAALLAELNIDIQQLHADAQPNFFKVPISKNDELIAIYARHLGDEHTRIFIAEADGEAQGCILLIHRQHEANPYAFANSRMVIDQLSVNENYRGKGLGHALMQRAIELSHELEVDYLWLNVWAFNEAAIEFYKREGFETVSLNMWQKIKSE
jgi:ribosomal protein S18 acetylase RimI-like enzyme